MSGKEWHQLINDGGAGETAYKLNIRFYFSVIYIQNNVLQKKDIVSLHLETLLDNMLI